LVESHSQVVGDHIQAVGDHSQVVHSLEVSSAAVVHSQVVVHNLEVVHRDLEEAHNLEVADDDKVNTAGLRQGQGSAAFYAFSVPRQEPMTRLRMCLVAPKRLARADLLDFVGASRAMPTATAEDVEAWRGAPQK